MHADPAPMGAAAAVIGWLLSLSSLAFVMSVTPGPNNLLFAASGSRVGFWRTIPILAGMLLGVVVVIVACRVGLGAVVGDSRATRWALTGLAAGYLTWLGVKLWRTAGTPLELADGPPLSWWGMAGLQGLNPKTWLASVAFASGFLGANAPGGWRYDAVGIAVFLAVVSASASTWTAFGALVRERLTGRWLVRWNRFLSLVSVATGLALITGVGG